MKKKIKVFLKAFIKTTKNTLENVVFAGTIAIFLDKEHTKSKIAITVIFFVLTVIIDVFILKDESGG